MQNKPILTPKKILKIFDKLSNHWPNAQCELKHNNDFQLLIAVVLSAQTKDKAVNKALQPLLVENPQFSAPDLIKMGEQRFLQTIQSIGLAPTKAKNCLAIAKLIEQKFENKVPLEREALESLPGVGRKTANVVLNVLAGMPTMAVDTHVERVSQRIGLVEQTKNRLKIEEQLLAIVPKKHALLAHHLLIFLGRYLCTARTPKCESCPIEQECKKIQLSFKR
ncbi:MAG: endonuclease III [Silvanigrellaceae bacterium]|nr:endonuclease III [Silvanigrellaceae bacterium]